MRVPSPPKGERHVVGLSEESGLNKLTKHDCDETEGVVRYTLTGSGFRLEGLWRRIHNRNYMLSIDEGTATQLRRNVLGGFKGLCVTIFLEIPCMYPRHCVQTCLSVPSTNKGHTLTQTKLLASNSPGKIGPHA